MVPINVATLIAPKSIGLEVKLEKFKTSFSRIDKPLLIFESNASR